jgi:hypothetical protein
MSRRGVKLALIGSLPFYGDDEWKCKNIPYAMRLKTVVPCFDDLDDVRLEREVERLASEIAYEIQQHCSRQEFWKNMVRGLLQQIAVYDSEKEQNQS